MCQILCCSALHSLPESWELMPAMWQHRDGRAGLSRIDISWRRFVVAHPCTQGTIKLKIIGSESPPFIDPLESVNSPRYKLQQILNWREMDSLAPRCPQTESCRGTMCVKERKREAERQAQDDLSTGWSSAALFKETCSYNRRSWFSVEVK